MLLPITIVAFMLSACAAKNQQQTVGNAEGQAISFPSIDSHWESVNPDDEGVQAPTGQGVDRDGLHLAPQYAVLA